MAFGGTVLAGVCGPRPAHLGSRSYDVSGRVQQSLVRVCSLVETSLPLYSLKNSLDTKLIRRFLTLHEHFARLAARI